MSVRLVPRLVVLCVSALLIAGCARSAPDPDPGGKLLVANPCQHGHPGTSTKQAPIVCIDDSARTLVVFPDPVRVHDARSDNRTAPVAIQWYTKSGTGDVHVQMGPACDSVKIKGCNGGGKCEAQTTPGKVAPCKYDVWITGGQHDRLDPTVVIDPCCT